jgi:biotin transporter BioY
MISPSKVFLELLLLAVVIVLLRKQGKSSHRTFVLWFTGITFALNVLFYYLAAWTLYASFGQSQGLPDSTLHLFVWFDIVKWAVLAYFLSRFVVEVPELTQAGGFLILRQQHQRWTIAVAGIVGGLLTTTLFYSMSYLQHHLGLLDVVPWPYFKGNELYIKLGLWGGLRNLAGEEILTRLGVQSVLLYVLAKHKWAPVFAILLSSFYFEFWHNGFRELNFLNFTASLSFGFVYQKFGYESAAISHTVADWLGLVVIPNVFL